MFMDELEAAEERMRKMRGRLTMRAGIIDAADLFPVGRRRNSLVLAMEEGDPDADEAYGPKGDAAPGDLFKHGRPGKVYREAITRTPGPMKGTV